jgi:hypothetical protein
MNAFVSSLEEQIKSRSFEAELILVDWNPPDDRPGLAEAIKWPSGSSPLTMKVIVVPPSIHRRCEYSDSLPFFQMIAKNVGIRRARAPLVVATNIDILFNNEMANFLRDLSPSPGAYYRVDRYDVGSELPEGSTEDRLRYCSENVIRICGRDDTRFLGSTDVEKIYSSAVIPLTINRVVQAVVPKGVRESLPLAVRHAWRRNLRMGLRPRLHTNACGDFTMLHRDDWIRLRGYPELEMFSIHLDSLLLYVAHYAGIAETVVEDPARIYHIEHDQGWVSVKDPVPRSSAEPGGSGSPEGKAPALTFEDVRDWVLEMKRTGAPKIVNDLSWGLDEEHLEEIVIKE